VNTIESVLEEVGRVVAPFDPTKPLAHESNDAYLGRLVRQIVEHKGAKSVWLKVVPRYSDTGQAFVVDPITPENLAMALSGLREPQPIAAPKAFAVLALDGSVLSEHGDAANAHAALASNPKGVRVVGIRRIEVPA
jgi:hypothetical protein